MNFRSFLSEAKDQLDISIMAAGKYLTNSKRIEDFLMSEVQVEHKTDGVKLTVIKKSNRGRLDDYIFAYKGNILYSSEYDYQPNTKVKSESIGASQFKTVFQHFNKLDKNSIPIGTELFIEFLMSKPTLSSNYNTKHKMVLIGHSKSKWTESFGKLKTIPQGMSTDRRDEFANQLKIDVPQLLFKGKMGSELFFQKGIIHKGLKSEFAKRANSFSWQNLEILVDDIRTLFLDIESKYGGTEEGVVIKYNDKILKWQQEYQLDQEARLQIKMKYKSDDYLEEGQYWQNITRTALEITNGIVVKNRNLEDVLKELAVNLKSWKLDFKHPKKTVAQIKDDIQLNSKTLIVKSMEGNNNALILGKFRVLTKEGHTKLIKQAQRLYDNVVVCIVTSKDTKDTKELREKMIRKTFPGVEIIHAATGNLISIINKSPININVVYAGSDRVDTYRQQLRNNIGMSVMELPRTDDDISASKVISEIDDEDFFKKNTPRAIHSMYDEIKGAY